MRPEIARISTSGWLVAASIGAASLAAGLSAAIGASVRATPELAERIAREPELPALDPGGATGHAVRSPIACAPKLDESALEESADETGTSTALAAAIDPDLFHMASFDVQARAIARTLDSEAVRDLARLAADRTRTAADRVAAAAVLRNCPDAERFALPGAALIVLRDAWNGRESDPTLAAAAVGSLAVFGDREDRRALLDESSTSSSSAALARAGLSAARGDEAALEIAAAAADSRDPRRSEVAVSALTAIASARDRDISEAGRSLCADILARALAADTSKDPPSARRLSALAVLDAGRAEGVLVATLADASSCDASAQSAASALAANGTHASDLERLLADAHLSDRRRALVAETLLQSSARPFPEARSLLERARDEGPGSLLGRRAARVLERADADARDPSR